MADVLGEILADRVSGASEIEDKVVAALAGHAAGEAVRLARELSPRLMTTFPQMANVRELAEELERLAGEASGDALLDFLSRRRAPERKDQLSSIVVPLLPRGDLLVFTLSKSGTVSSVLNDLYQSGRKLAVLVAESRPGAEGSRMARELGERGIRCRACDDFLLLSLVPPEAAPRRPPGYVGEAVVLVGADAVHPDALVNKVGTRALLETARYAGVPAYVLAASSKLRSDPAPRALGSLFETIPREGIRVLTERGPA